MFKGYRDVSQLGESQLGSDDLRKMAKDSYLAEKKRQREGEALLNSVDFDAAIVVWQNRVSLEIRLSNRHNLDEAALDLSEKEQKELDNWKLQAIYDQGGALNWPGFYYPNEQIVQLINRRLKERGLK